MGRMAGFTQSNKVAQTVLCMLISVKAVTPMMDAQNSIRIADSATLPLFNPFLAGYSLPVRCLQKIAVGKRFDPISNIVRVHVSGGIIQEVDALLYWPVVRPINIRVQQRGH